MTKEEIKNILLVSLKSYSPKKIALFGSYVRGDNKADSDLDVLVDFRNKVNLFDLISIEMMLGEKLGMKVDLVTDRSLHPAIRTYIEKEMEVILND